MASDWRACWYPIAFARDLGDGLHRVSVHDTFFVLFRSNAGWSCLRDRCPHRSARLSDGRLMEGTLECGYHGWQFSPEGRCLAIPQLPASQEIPAKACVEAFAATEVQGIVWIWPGVSTEAEAQRIPALPDLELPDCRSVDFAIDLPYEQTFLIENVIDIAHIHIAHDGIRGGGRREMAAPIGFDVSEVSASGFSASFKSIGLEDIAGGPAMRAAHVRFRAPNLVHYESAYEELNLHSGLGLYSLPLGANRCRLLYRSYSDFGRLRDRLRPRWLEHRTQCDILEQDMAVVMGQAEEIETSGRPPAELWLPLKTSDPLVISYREWLDDYASEWPYRVGFRHLRQAAVSGVENRALFDRYKMHTLLCSSCSRAELWCRAVRTPLAISMIALLALAALAAGSKLSAAAAAAALATAFGVGSIERIRARFH